MNCKSPNFVVLFKKFLGSLNESKMEGLTARNFAEFSQMVLRSKRSHHQQQHIEDMDGIGRPKCERIMIEGDILSYCPGEETGAGIYIGCQPISPFQDYFEIEIIDAGIDSELSVGLCPRHHSIDENPGWTPGSIAYYASDGRLYKGRSFGVPFGPRCENGDRVGCGIRFEQQTSFSDSYPVMVPIFFTKNGKEVGSTMVPLQKDGSSNLFPSVSLHSSGAEIRLTLDLQWVMEEDTRMAVDSCEDEWLRLHDVRLNGQVLEYIGRGKSIMDVGIAQARSALNTTYHYFEIEIIDPGESCYVAIGLARRDYPMHRHPGWNKGSIAYHADDGKIFIGSGVGDPFGPKCERGDVMGCGILFPPDYLERSSSDGSSSYDGESMESPEQDGYLEINSSSNPDSDSEDDEWWKNSDNGVGRRVYVYFTRNGSTIGKKEVRIPKGGFYPTVGMLSSEEKVRVDLHPLSG